MWQSLGIIRFWRYTDLRYANAMSSSIILVLFYRASGWDKIVDSNFVLTSWGLPPGKRENILYLIMEQNI